MIPLDYTTAYRAYQNILTSHLGEVRKSLFKAAVRYATIRGEWHFLSREEREETDTERTAAHNHFIDCCNILSRQQALWKEDTSWRTDITDDRKMIGDFACYLSCFIGIQNR